MTPEDQLTLIQIGAFTGRYMPEYTLPASMDEAAAIIQKNLDLSISKGDTFNSIRKKIMTAIKEHDELMQVGEEIYNEFMYEQMMDEIYSVMSKEIANEFDRFEELLEMIREEAAERKVTSFDEAMKIV